MPLLIGYTDISSYNITSSEYIPGGENTALNYYSINQLYYSSFDQDSGTILQSSSFNNFTESSFTSASRFLNSEGLVYSIPRSLYGTHIQPGSVSFSTSPYTLIDDGEGNLIRTSNNSHAGNVIYSHGLIIITDSSLYSVFESNLNQPISWSANLPIHTFNATVKVSDYECNYTFNPTAQKNSYTETYSGSRFIRTLGDIADFATGSTFQPYFTTVGLYNDSNELIAVGKMGQPVPMPADTELTINIKLDI